VATKAVKAVTLRLSNSDVLDGRVRGTHHLLDAHLVEDVLQQLHVSSITMVDPWNAFDPGWSDWRFTMPLPWIRTRSPRFSRM
jgi:hypothetical protein